MKRKICIAGMIVGLVMLFFGLAWMFSFGSTDWYIPQGYTFGADYYTEQYAVTRAVSVNLSTLGDIVSNGFRMLGIFTVLLGAADICYFGYKYYNTAGTGYAAAGAEIAKPAAPEPQILSPSADPDAAARSAAPEIFFPEKPQE